VGPDGRRIQLKAEGANNERAAKAFLSDKLREFDSERSAQGPCNNRTIGELKTAYLAALAARCGDRHVESTENNLKAILNILALQRISDITTERVEAYIQDRLHQKVRIPHAISTRKISKSTCNHELCALKSMLKWGTEHGILEHNPIRNVKKLKIRKSELRKRRRALTPAEVGKLLLPENSPNGLDLVWVMFLGTGLRRGELCDLRWKNVELDCKPAIVRITEQKNGEISELPLPQVLVTRLTAYLDTRIRSSRRRDDLVFPSENGTSLYPNLLRRLYGCLKRAGIRRDGVDIHSLRKTYVTDLLRQGVPVKVVQQLARHKCIEVTMAIYAEVFTVDLVRGVEQLSLFNGGIQVTPQVTQSKPKSA
jgi:integrase/recombinase XerD